MKILAVKLRAIGDTVIWTSALSALKSGFPSARIHTLTYASNAAVLKNLPFVEQTHFLSGRSDWELVRRLAGLRGERFDLFLGFHATASLCRWAWLAGAKQKALHHHSWTHSPRGSLAIPEPGRLEDAIARDYQLLRAAGVSPERRPTQLIVTAGESAKAEQQMQAAIREAGGDPARERFLFLPGAGHHLRRYPKEQLLPVIAKVRAAGEYQPVVLADGALSREWNLREECKRIGVPLLDEGSLRDFICLVSRGRRALANDSGPGHIAVALGLRTDFVFGPGCVGDWHPYDRALHRVHRAEVPCRANGPREQEAFQFCTVDACEHHSCMRKLGELTFDAHK
jgi:ADP-heptose:LPS heptosyltransferase